MRSYPVKENPIGSAVSDILPKECSLFQKLSFSKYIFGPLVGNGCPKFTSLYAYLSKFIGIIVWFVELLFYGCCHPC